MPERNDIDEALLKWFKQQRSGNVPVTGSGNILFLKNFNFNFSVNLCENLQLQKS